MDKGGEAPFWQAKLCGKPNRLPFSTDSQPVVYLDPSQYLAGESPTLDSARRKVCGIAAGLKTEPVTGGKDEELQDRRICRIEMTGGGWNPNDPPYASSSGRLPACVRELWQWPRHRLDSREADVEKREERADAVVRFDHRRCIPTRS